MSEDRVFILLFAALTWVLFCLGWVLLALATTLFAK